MPYDVLYVVLRIRSRRLLISEEKREGHTAPVTRSLSMLMNAPISSKYTSPNWAFLIILVLNRPLSSIINSSIWLLDRPGRRIFPVYSS